MVSGVWNLHTGGAKVREDCWEFETSLATELNASLGSVARAGLVWKKKKKIHKTKPNTNVSQGSRSHRVARHEDCLPQVCGGGCLCWSPGPGPPDLNRPG